MLVYSAKWTACPPIKCEKKFKNVVSRAALLVDFGLINIRNILLQSFSTTDLIMINQLRCMKFRSERTTLMLKWC